MRAAIYSRKSTAQHDVADEARSTTRQIEGARAYIAEQGWTLNEAHVYTDEGVSGALFASRAAFQQMMTDAAAEAFDVLVLYDLDRFGRNARLTMEALNVLADNGIAVHDYRTRKEILVDSLEGDLVTFMHARFAQHERDQAKKRAYDAAKRRAQQGYVTGGKVFGYTNKRLGKGQTIREIYEPEATVVRTIFQWYADGEGARTIAERLNHMGAPSPRAQQERMSGWSQTTVRDVLKRPLYRGEVVWGKTANKEGRALGKRKGRNGQLMEMAQLPQPEETWIRLPPNESLRIVDAELAARVDALHEHKRARYFTQQVQNGMTVLQRTHGEYLLTGGMLVCSACKANFEAVKYPFPAYVCSTRRRKPGTCKNDLVLPMDHADDVVLSMVENTLLGTEFIEELLSIVDRGQIVDRSRLEADRERLRGEVQNLVKSLAAGVPAETIAPGIRARELEISRLEARLRAPLPEQPRIDELREALLQRAADWKKTLRAEPLVGRLLLRRLIGPFVLNDESQMPDFIRADCEVKTGLLDGLAPHSGVAPNTLMASPGADAAIVNTEMASPTGFEPVFWP